MKFLVIEKNYAIARIYKKLFNEKKHDIDFVESEKECFDMVLDYDYVILENRNISQRSHIENEIAKKKAEQKILFLPKPANSSENQQIRKETRDLIEKPFSMVEILAQIELKGLTTV